MDFSSILNFLLKMVGLGSTPTQDGAYFPSKFALQGVSFANAITPFEGGIYENPYNGSKRILMVCTEERNMVMTNDKKFSTGNHPVEVGLPMLHLLSAGFKIDVVTPTGAPVVFEEWAMQGKKSN